MKALRQRWRVYYTHRYMTHNAPNDKLKALVALLIVLGLWSWAMNEDYKDQLNQQVELKRAYRKIMNNCATQAVNGGTASFIIGNEAFGMDCTLLSDDAYGGVRK